MHRGVDNMSKYKKQEEVGNTMTKYLQQQENDKGTTSVKETGLSLRDLTEVLKT